MNKLLQTKSSHLNSERELNKRTREIEQLYAAGIKLGNSLDLSTIYDNICSIVEDVMECDDFFVSTYSKEDNLIRCCYMKHQGKLMDVESLPPLILNR